MRQKSSGQGRRPLYDLSNTTLLSISSSSFKPSSRLVAPISSSDTSVGSSNSRQSSRKSQANPEPESSSLSENIIDKENYGHPKIDSRSHVEGEKNKGKAVAVVVPSSCPPANRSKALGDGLKNLENVDLSKEHSVLECKSTKKRRYSMPEAPVRTSPQDFIDKQRAYFAEIDAFELTEEVVSESELE